MRQRLVSCLVGTLHIAWTSACDHGWLTIARISLVVSKRYRSTMIVLHLQCRPTIKPMPSKCCSIETSHVQRDQTARPLGPTTRLLEVWHHNPIWTPLCFSALHVYLGWYGLRYILMITLQWTWYKDKLKHDYIKQILCPRRPGNGVGISSTCDNWCAVSEWKKRESRICAPWFVPWVLVHWPPQSAFHQYGNNA